MHTANVIWPKIVVGSCERGNEPLGSIKGGTGWVIVFSRRTLLHGVSYVVNVRIGLIFTNSMLVPGYISSQAWHYNKTFYLVNFY